MVTHADDSGIMLQLWIRHVFVVMEALVCRLIGSIKLCNSTELCMGGEVLSAFLTAIERQVLFLYLWHSNDLRLHPLWNDHIDLHYDSITPWHEIKARFITAAGIHRGLPSRFFVGIMRQILCDLADRMIYNL